MIEFFNTFSMSDTELRLISYSISGRGQTPEKVTSTDLFYLRSMDQGTANVPYLLAQYLFRHADGRKSKVTMYGGHFIGRRAEHFGLVSEEGLMGLYAWVAPEPKTLQVAVAGAPEVIEGAPDVDEGAQAIPALRHMVRQRTGEASTSAAPLNEDQQDP
ncbi:hypothetical protein Tco_0806032 [Tanacetum coccineum]